MSVESGEGTVLRCANHPEVETHLRCSRCGKPICVQCVIQTPVGGRCAECAQVKKAPIFMVNRWLYARASVYGLVVAVATGLVWAQTGSLLGLSPLLLLLVGYAVGEAVSRGADGRISRGLVVMAGAFTVLGAVVGRAATVVLRLPPVMPLDARLGFALQYGFEGQLTSLFGLLFLLLAVVIATSRIR